ncbi:MAG: hypothetical protein HY318_19610 [Armatimonadetes bacterium]|nr:hypothetical protein [Armatimonadota bacterium]
MADSENSSPPTEDHAPGEGSRRLSPLEIVLSALNLLLTITPIHLGIIAVGLVGYLCFSFRGGPDFSKLKISDTYESFQAEDQSWQITYEYAHDSQFDGVVRYIARWHDRNMLIMTHDLLVTSGDYADPKKVHTWVHDHIYMYRSQLGKEPGGTINLLHIVPASEEVYRRLRHIHEGDTVSVSGREILLIKAYDKTGDEVADEQDMGCNSILVKSVTIHHRP